MQGLLVSIADRRCRHRKDHLCFINDVVIVCLSLGWFVIYFKSPIQLRLYLISQKYKYYAKTSCRGVGYSPTIGHGWKVAWGKGGRGGQQEKDNIGTLVCKSVCFKNKTMNCTTY